MKKSEIIAGAIWRPREQQASRPQVVGDDRRERAPRLLAHAQHVGDGLWHECRIGERGQRDEAGAVREIGGARGGKGKGEAGLADAAGAGQRQQTHVVAAQQRGGGSKFALAADQGR